MSSGWPWLGLVGRGRLMFLIPSHIVVFSECVNSQSCFAEGLEDAVHKCSSNADDTCMCAEGYSGSDCSPMSKYAL